MASHAPENVSGPQSEERPCVHAPEHSMATALPELASYELWASWGYRAPELFVATAPQWTSIGESCSGA
eukprot:7658423-Alexandrium_andersonii.AAC.1